MALGVNAVFVSYAVHLLGVVTAILVLIWTISFRGGLAWSSSDKSLIFNLHPVFMAIGFIVLGGEAIISYKCLPLKKAEKKLVHLVLHAIALVLGIIGTYTAFKYHNESNIANLYSVHSWIGIGVLVLYGLQWICGFIVFFYPGGSPSIRSESLPWHVVLGTFVYILAILTAVLGYLEKLTFLEVAGVEKYGSEAFLVNFSALVAVLYGTFVILTTLSHAPPEDDYSYSAI